MKQLFIDDHVVEEITNLVRKLHQPQKFEANAVVRPEHRWENIAIQVRTAPAWAPEEGVFKMMYGASSESLDPDAGLTVTGDPAGEGFVCLATSPDGVNWEKPFLELHDYKGLWWNGEVIGHKNNIVPDGMWLSPYHDPSDPDPERRYKGMGWLKDRPGLSPAVSSDCLNWRYLDVAPVASSDEAQLTHDVSSGRFLLTVKHGGPYGRSVYLTTSEDFETWSEQQLIFHADERDQENGKERLARFFDDQRYLAPVINRPEEYQTDVYHHAVFPYEGLYLGLPVMFHWSGKHPPMYENVDGRKTIELTSSRDLRRWDRVADRAPFMTLSPVGDGSAYDTGQLEPTNRPILRNDELWFYYTGLRHRCLTLGEKTSRAYLDCGAVCMAKLRLDGFVSLKGGIEWGSVLTKPIPVEGRELHINADSWRGQVRAEVLDADNCQPISGFTTDASVPAVIDRIDVTLRWKDKPEVSELIGKVVRLRFSILKAEMYAFWFAD